MLQYKIPQNVQLEDKIVSFLTIRQLIICAIGGGIAYVLYITLAPNYYGEVWMPPVFLISAVTIAIAFVKVNDIPFIKWVLLLIEFFAKPRKRIWDKSANTNLLFAFVTSKRSTEAEHQKIKDEKINIENQKNFSALEEITKKLDQNPFSDIEKKIDRTDNSDDNRLAHSTLMSEEDIDSHEKRIAAIIAMQKKRKEKKEEVEIQEVKLEAQNLKPSNIGVFEKKQNQVPEVQVVEESRIEAEPIDNDLIKADGDLNHKEEFDVIVKKEVVQSENLGNFHKEEVPKLSTENIISNTKEISKDDFLNNKKKKLLRRAFPMPIFKEKVAKEETSATNTSTSFSKEVVSNNVEKISSTNSHLIPNRPVISSDKEANNTSVQPSSNKEIVSNDVEKTCFTSTQSIQPKRFTPVREKTNVDTSKKPVIPKEHEILLSQIKEGEIQINFSNNNE